LLLGDDDDLDDDLDDGADEDGDSVADADASGSEELLVTSGRASFNNFV
jgi:hypothetical protein